MLLVTVPFCGSGSIQCRGEEIFPRTSENKHQLTKGDEASQTSLQTMLL